MKAKRISRGLLWGVLLLVLTVAACRGVETEAVGGDGVGGVVASATGTVATNTQAAATVVVATTHVPMATAVASLTPEPTQVVVSTVPPPATVTATVAPVAVTVEATSTAQAPGVAVTRGAPGVVVTSEPYVDVWTYSTGVSSAQIQGSLQTTIAFLNAIIIDESGRGTLPYLSEWLHGEAVADPDDNLVLGIRTGFTGFEVQWLGGSGSSRVQATVIYEDGTRAVHVVELARSGEVWQIGGWGRQEAAS